MWGTGESGSITLDELKGLITNDTTEQAKITFKDVEGKASSLGSRIYTGKKIYYDGELIGIIVANADGERTGFINLGDRSMIISSFAIDKKINEITHLTIAQIKAIDLDNNGIIEQNDAGILMDNYLGKVF